MSSFHRTLNDLHRDCVIDTGRKYRNSELRLQQLFKTSLPDLMYVDTRDVKRGRWTIKPQTELPSSLAHTFITIVWYETLRFLFTPISVEKVHQWLGGNRRPRASRVPGTKIWSVRRIISISSECRWVGDFGVVYPHYKSRMIHC